MAAVAPVNSRKNSDRLPTTDTIQTTLTVTATTQLTKRNTSFLQSRQFTSGLETIHTKQIANVRALSSFIPRPIAPRTARARHSDFWRAPRVISQVRQNMARAIISTRASDHALRAMASAGGETEYR